MPGSRNAPGSRHDRRTDLLDRYHINVFWSEEDVSWAADVPDLQFCSAFGDTPEEALREVRVGMAAWLESAREHGETIPAACYRSAIYAARVAA